jgi:NADPH2:quinone reductase
VYASTTEPVRPPWALMEANAHIGFALGYTMPDEAKRAAVDDITVALLDGTLTALPGTRFPLAETAAAHDAV